MTFSDPTTCVPRNAVIIPAGSTSDVHRSRSDSGTANACARTSKIPSRSSGVGTRISMSIDADATGTADGQMSDEQALRAPRPAGDADPAPVQDQPQRERAALLGRDDPVQVELDLHRVRLVRELEQLREPQHVRVDGQPGQPERDRPDDVAGLAADAGQRDEVLEVGRHLAVEPLLERVRPCR